MEQIYDTVIIGSGPAGLTAAIYNVRSALKTIVIAGHQPGGQLTTTTTVENYPGFPNGTGGLKLMMDMQNQVKNLGCEIKSGSVTKIEKMENFKIILDDREILESKSVIVATGAKIKWTGLPNEDKLKGRGVSGCATCDAAFFKEKIVAVMGGGDTACEEADFLTKFAKKVYLIHRRDSLRASEIEQKKVIENNKIEILWNTEVKEIIGENKLEKVKVTNNQTSEERFLEIDGLFVAIGYNPVADFLRELVETDEIGHILVGRDQRFKTMTSVPGIFAAGDCVNSMHRQAIIAAGDGARAGLDAENWLEEN